MKERKRERAKGGMKGERGIPVNLKGEKTRKKNELYRQLTEGGAE